VIASFRDDFFLGYHFSDTINRDGPGTAFKIHVSVIILGTYLGILEQSLTVVCSLALGVII
jgi:hypothetical protein